jgi:hypothetical protein
MNKKEISEIKGIIEGKVVKYNLWKSQLFHKVFKYLVESSEIYESLYFLRADSNDNSEYYSFPMDTDETDDEREYFSLVALYFKDGDGKDRAIFLPYPLATKKEKEIISKIDPTYVVSREWHDQYNQEYILPIGYYPSHLPTKESGSSDPEEFLE